MGWLLPATNETCDECDDPATSRFVDCNELLGELKLLRNLRSHYTDADNLTFTHQHFSAGGGRMRGLCWVFEP